MIEQIASSMETEQEGTLPLRIYSYSQEECVYMTYAYSRGSEMNASTTWAGARKPAPLTYLYTADGTVS